MVENGQERAGHVFMKIGTVPKNSFCHIDSGLRTHGGKMVKSEQGMFL